MNINEIPIIEENLKSLQLDCKKKQKTNEIYDNQNINQLTTTAYKSILKNKIKKICHYAEVNDIYNFNIMMAKIEYIILNKVKNIPSKQQLYALVTAIEKIIGQNMPDINTISNSLRFLKTLLKKKNLKIKLDWKNYYKIYFLTNGYSCYEFRYYFFAEYSTKNTLNSFFSISNLYNSFDMSEEDYQYLRNKEIIRLLHSGSDTELLFALNLIRVFIKPNRLIKDQELLNNLYKIMVNIPMYTSYICVIFKDLMKKGLPIVNEDFLENLFNVINNFITSNISLLGVQRVKKDNKMSQQYMQHSRSLTKILSSLLFNEKYNDLRKQIDKHFQVLINLVDFNLKESTKPDIVRFNLGFIKSLLTSFKKSIMKEKDKINQDEDEEKSETEIEDITEDLDEEETNKEKDEEKEEIALQQNNTRLEEVLNIMEPTILKALFYSERVSSNVISEAQRLSAYLPVSKNIFDAFYYLFENSDNDYNTFITKVDCYLKCFLNNYSKDKEITEFFNTVLSTSLDKITSVSMPTNNSIFLFLTKLYLIMRNHKVKKTEEMKKLINKLDDIAILIVKKIFNLFNLIATSTHINITVSLLRSICFYVNDEKLKEIFNIAVDYAKNNVISKDNISSYFTLLRSFVLINADLYRDLSVDLLLWKFIYKSLIIKIQNEIVKSPYNLCDYELSDKNLAMDTINNESRKYFKSLIKHLYFRRIHTTDEIKAEMFNLIYLLMNDNNYKFQKIAFQMLKNMIPNKLLVQFKMAQNDSGKISTKLYFPENSELEVVIEIYEKFYAPYISYLDNYVNEFNQKYNVSVSDKGISKYTKDHIKLWKEELSNTDNIQKILNIYLNIQAAYSIKKSNFFLLNSDIPRIKNKFDLSVFDASMINHYDKIKNIEKSMNEFSYKIFRFAHKFELLSAQSARRDYLRSLINHHFDNTFSYANSMKSNIRSVNKNLKSLTHREKHVLLNDLEVALEFCAHLRAWKSRQVVDPLLTKNLLVFAKNFLDNNDNKLKNKITTYIESIAYNYILGKKEVNKIFEKLFDFYCKKIKKIKVENNTLSITDKSRLLNLFQFYCAFLLFRNKIDPWQMIETLNKTLTLSFLAYEKKFNAINVVESSIMRVVSEIKYKLPKNMGLVEKKLKVFPYVNNLIHKNFDKSELYKRYVKKIENTLTEKTQKHAESIEKLKQDTRTFLDSFQKLLDLDKGIQNTLLGYHLHVNNLVMMILCLNYNNKQDRKIIKNFENFFFKTLLSDAILVLKRISLIGFSIILRMKYLNEKNYDITHIEDPEKVRELLTNESKNNKKGLSPYAQDYIRVKSYTTKKMNKIIAESINNEESLTKLINSLIEMKDLQNDQSLMKGIINMPSFSDIVTIVNAALTMIQNPQGTTTQYTFFLEDGATQLLFSVFDCIALAHLSFLYKFDNYDFIIKHFENLISSNSNKDKTVYISVYMHFLGGLIISDLWNKNHERIRKYIFEPMKYYTNNINKKIDGEIMNYFSLIISKMSVNDFNKLFYDDKNEKNILKFFEYGPEISLKFNRVLSHLFNLKSNLIINEASIKEIENLIEIYSSDNVKVVKNMHILKKNITSYPLIASIKKYDFENFKTLYDEDKTQKFFRFFLDLSKKMEIKEMKQICIDVTFWYKRYLIEHPELLNEILYEISKTTYLDIEDFERHLSVIRQHLKFPCYKIDLVSHLKLTEKILYSLDNIHSKKFFIDLLSNLLRSNLIDIENNYINILNYILSMINNSQYEIKEYIVNTILTNFVHSMDNDSNNVLIQELIEKLKNSNTNSNTNNSTNNNLINIDYKFHSITDPLSIIFVLGTYLKSFDLLVPESVQDIIIAFKQSNLKVFKNRGNESKLIKKLIGEYFNRYKYTFNYAKKTMKEECVRAIEDLSRGQSYYM
jgi:hypothetical protein